MIDRSIDPLVDVLLREKTHDNRQNREVGSFRFPGKAQSKTWAHLSMVEARESREPSSLGIDI